MKTGTNSGLDVIHTVFGAALGAWCSIALGGSKECWQVFVKTSQFISVAVSAYQGFQSKRPFSILFWFLLGLIFIFVQDYAMSLLYEFWVLFSIIVGWWASYWLLRCGDKFAQSRWKVRERGDD